METAKKLSSRDLGRERLLTEQEQAAANKLCLRFLSRPENVSLARLLTAALAAERELTVAELDEIKVAVSEAVSNAIIHGYNNQPDCYVELSLALTERQLIVCIHDDGVGIRDVEQALRPNWSSGGRMGLGFAFMHSFMDAVEVVSAPGQGATVTLYKDLP